MINVQCKNREALDPMYISSRERIIAERQCRMARASDRTVYSLYIYKVSVSVREQFCGNFHCMPRSTFCTDCRIIVVVKFCPLNFRKKHTETTRGEEKN